MKLKKNHWLKKKIKEEKNRAKQNTISMNSDLWGEVQ